MKTKVCGMKHNAPEVALLQPDYLGFIFWEPSPRFFEGAMPELPPEIKKVGVFVNAPAEEVLDKVRRYSLDAVQLHGKETPDYCRDLRPALGEGQKISIIKVFSIREDFDFEVLMEYEGVCDYYLFDTKGKLPGGNGYAFNWELLKGYPSAKPYFLSGGIGPEDLPRLNEFVKWPQAFSCIAIDLNSKFEIRPGLKNLKKLKKFTREVTEISALEVERIPNLLILIENSNSLKDLEDLSLKIESKIPNKYHLNKEKYPEIGYHFTTKDIQNLKNLKLSLSEKITQPNHTLLEKLLLALLWKQSDFGKEQHIIEGILSKGDLRSKSAGHVFYQFGKRLADPENEPILDQHVLRAFLYLRSNDDVEKKSIRKRKGISKKDLEDIKMYKEWIKSQANRIKGERTQIFYVIDQILYAFGKYIKINN